MSAYSILKAHCTNPDTEDDQKISRKRNSVKDAVKEAYLTVVLKIYSKLISKKAILVKDKGEQGDTKKSFYRAVNK